MKALGYWLAFLVLVLQTGCVNSHQVNFPGPVTTSKWDTSFTIDQVRFPDSGAILRSVVGKGEDARLSAFFKKILRGNEVNIGYIGGSITAGAGASNPNNCYASELASFVRKLFVNSKINVINAGIGSTNTRFGCSRIQEDLLDKNPDMVFVEFAVNDNPVDTFTTMAAMEGIVRQCLKHENLPVIIFNTFNSQGDSANQELFERIAGYYNLPTVSYRNAIWPLIQGNQMSWASLVADAIHPNDRGHFLCAYLLYEFLKGSFSQLDTTVNASDSIPECRITDLYEHAGIHHAPDSLLREQTDDWQKITGEFGRMSYQSQRNADSLVLETNVQELVIAFNYSLNGSSKIQIAMDGRSTDTISNYWGNGTSSGYMGLYRIYLDQNADAHQVKIMHLDNNLFTMNYLLFSSMGSCFKSIESQPIRRLNF